MRAFLESSGVGNVAADPTMSPESAHTWWWADEHLCRTLPFHARCLYDALR